MTHHPAVCLPQPFHRRSTIPVVLTGRVSQQTTHAGPITWRQDPSRSTPPLFPHYAQSLQTG